MLSNVAILRHPRHEGAGVLAEQVTREFQRAGVASFVRGTWDDDADETTLAGTDLVVCVGGDGTVLRAASLAIPHNVPILGINMGRLGFLTDASPRDFFNNFERVVSQDWRIEERLMVQATLEGEDGTETVIHGLNDIVVSRAAVGRPVYVNLKIDGARVAEYRCDGMIVATPTGSTGYSLSAGGPILAPTEHHLVVTPASPHLALGRSLVLQANSHVDLEVTSDEGAILSVDGQEDRELSPGSTVSAVVSPHRTRFVRFRPLASFYADLAERLEAQLSSPTNERA